MPSVSAGQVPHGNAGSKPDSFARQAPAVNLPEGGRVRRGMDEKSDANPVTGTGSISVLITTSPGRSGLALQFSVSDDAGAGNEPFGFGWVLSLPAITRKTDKGLPLYLDAIESDVIILSGSEDLIPLLGADDKRYEDRDTFARYVIRHYHPGSSVSSSASNARQRALALRFYEAFNN